MGNVTGAVRITKMVRVAGAFGTALTGAGEVVGEAGAIKVTEKEGGPGGE